MCSNSAKYLVERVANTDSEAMQDNEETFEQLYTRLDKTIELLEKVESDSMKDDGRTIHVETPLTSFDIGVTDYVLLYAVPNFHFHLTTAYGIMRSQGVPLSKLDYVPIKTTGSKMTK